MNISYKWLKEYVDFDLNPQEVADALTSEGLEVNGVEEIQAIKGGLEGLVVAHVLTCEPHPNSDHCMCARWIWAQVNLYKLCAVLRMWLLGRRLSQQRSVQNYTMAINALL